MSKAPPVILNGAALISLKDAIHTKWYELQRDKKSNSEYAFLNKNLYEEIIKLGKKALRDLKKINPQSPYLAEIQGIVDQIVLKSYTADETKIGMVPYYAMTPERGQEVITQDINKLANQVHRAGMREIKFTGNYCGCDLAEGLEDLRSINTGVLKYCEGTLQLGHKRGKVMEPGDKVEHRPGTAESHANVVVFVPTEKGFDVEMEYVESGDSNWRLRQDGVIGFINDKGGSCSKEDIFTKCTLKDVSEDHILEVALLISQMKDIDLLPANCVEVAFDGVKAQIPELKVIEPAQDIWKSRWTRAGDMTSVRSCQGKVEEEEYEQGEAELRAERRQERHQRLEIEVDNYGQAVEYAAAKVKEDPCSIKAYGRLADVDFVDEIRNLCNRIKDETDESHVPCLDLADDIEEVLTQAAKELVERCNPEPIILGLEAAQYPGFICDEIRQISDVCTLAGNEECLKVVQQVRLRAEKEIYPKLLPFEEFKGDIRA